MLRSSNVPKGIHPNCRRGASVLITGLQLRNMFKLCDSDGDGRLSKQELKKAFAKLGSHLPVWRARQGLRRADANGDGYISDEELDDLVNYALECGYTFK